MMIYNSSNDTVKQAEEENNTTKIRYGDVIIEQSLSGSRIYMVRNASKHIPVEILTKMTPTNEYLIRVEMGECENNSYDVTIKVLQKVEHVIPEHIVTEWEECY